MTETRKLSVFLCHSSQDKPIVNELCQRLSAEGWIDPWLDEEKLIPGQDWDVEIEKAVEVVDAVLVFLSKNSVSKDGYFQKELHKVLDIALEKKQESIFIIPLRLNDCEVPRRLRSQHHVDYFPAEKVEQAYKRLLQALNVRFQQLHPPKEGAQETQKDIANLNEEKILTDLSLTFAKTDLQSYNVPESFAIIESAGFVLAILSALVVTIFAPLSWNYNRLFLFTFIANIILVFCLSLLQYIAPSDQVRKCMTKIQTSNYWLIFTIWILPLPIYYIIVFKLIRGG